jgi:hypothetical protein
LNKSGANIYRDHRYCNRDFNVRMFHTG